jgi:ribosomal protein L32
MSMMLGSAIITKRDKRGTIYRSEAHISRTVSATMYALAAANVRECPDCGHPAYLHTAAGCVTSREDGQVCICQTPRDDIDTLMEDL